MKLGILGYFGFGNYGDELFLDIWEDIFSNETLVGFEEVTGLTKCMHSNEEERATFSNSVDAILIGGGDLIRPTGKINYWYQELLAKPVFLYGIGVATWLGKDPKVVEQIKAFLVHDNCISVGLRDIESYRWMLSNVPEIKEKLYVTPDIVFSMQESQAQNFERKTVGIITRHQKKYEQGRIDQMRLIKDIYQECGFDVVEILASTGPEKEWDLEGSKNWNIGCPTLTFDTDQEVTDAIKSCDVIYSMKFHGCVVGLYHHVPTISLLKTDKFVNLYKFLRLENWLIGGKADKVKLEDITNSRVQLWNNIDTVKEYSKVGLMKLKLDISSHIGE
ncbi:polysaccharide pyruvyl transferase family protein [Paraglaciecola sp. 2405UD69-4]|uniref:polysaccharide pyruvyl transferase family protein n=1 Tax=Paraglaciecola sp. 2405UD69-4 TaxID=3391836 RepID=UPI0039C9E161